MRILSKGRDIPEIRLIDLNHWKVHNFTPGGSCIQSINFEFPFHGRILFETLRGESELQFTLFVPGTWEIELVTSK